MIYNKFGAKYFIDLCTLNPDDDKCYMILPEDIKRNIWRLLHLKPYIECLVCNEIIMRLEYDIREDINTESVINLNGYCKCISC